jgi:hypothetical protein
MKKSLVLSVLLIFCVYGGANAQPQDYADTGISFRNEALCGAINDDFDLIFDPIELRFVNGINVFTNLSNLVDNDEYFMNNDSENTFFFGASAANPWLDDVWSSVLFKFRNYRDGGPVNFSYSDPWVSASASGSGFMEDEFSSYRDTDFNGILDNYHTISYMEENFTDNDDYDFILNNSADVGGMTVGARFAMGRYERLETTADDSSPYWSAGQTTFGWTERSHLLDVGKDEWYYMESGAFETLSKSSYTSLAGSAMIPDFMNKYELRGDVHFTSYLDQYQNIGTLSVDDESYDVDDDAYISNSYFRYHEDEQWEYDGTEFGLAGSIRRTFNQSTERKNDGYWKVGMGFNMGSYDYKDRMDLRETEDLQFFDGYSQLSTDYIQNYRATSESSDDGTGDTKQFMAGGILNIPANEDVFFGIGCYFSHMSDKADLVNVGSTVVSVDYTQDDELDDVNDYVTTSDADMIATHTMEYYNTSVYIPVGLEWRFTKNNKWAMRFGAMLNSYKSTSNELIQITRADAVVTETVRGDGTVSVDTGDNSYQSATFQDEWSRTYVDYCYGIGYNPNENLQIDLLGVFDDNGGLSDDVLDTGYLRRLRLSFSLKF